jgi:hypothetical protein
MGVYVLGRCHAEKAKWQTRNAFLERRRFDDVLTEIDEAG